MYRLIDTHAHLEEIENIEQTINDTKRANIVAIGEVGLDYDKRVRARADKERQKVVVPAGVENSPSPSPRQAGARPFPLCLAGCPGFGE